MPALSFSVKGNILKTERFENDNRAISLPVIQNVFYFPWRSVEEGHLMRLWSATSASSHIPPT